VLLRNFENMGVNVTEPFTPICTDSKEALLKEINSLMRDNIKGCGMIVTKLSKTEIDDENFISENTSYECFGDITKKECENLRQICLQV